MAGCYYHFGQGPVKSIIVALDRDQWLAVIITLDRDKWRAVIIVCTGARAGLLLSLWAGTSGGLLLSLWTGTSRWLLLSLWSGTSGVLLLSSAQGPEEGYYYPSGQGPVEGCSELGSKSSDSIKFFSLRVCGYTRRCSWASVFQDIILRQGVICSPHPKDNMLSRNIGKKLLTDEAQRPSKTRTWNISFWSCTLPYLTLKSLN